jgi:hypothetical protein
MDGGQSGGLEFFGNSGTLGSFSLSDNQIENSQYMGVLFNDPVGNLGTFTGDQITGSGTYGIDVYSGTSGSVTYDSATISGSGLGPLLNSGSLTITQNGDTGF